MKKESIYTYYVYNLYFILNKTIIEQFHKIQLEEQESGYDFEIDEIAKKNEELQQAVSDGLELADALVEKDEQLAFDLFAQVEELIENG